MVGDMRITVGERISLGLTFGDKLIIMVSDRRLIVGDRISLSLMFGDRN
jgi:hypothetical protein